MTPPPSTTTDQPRDSPTLRLTRECPCQQYNTAPVSEHAAVALAATPWCNVNMTATARHTSSEKLRGNWPTDPGTGRGRSHGTSSREPFDRWFRYPAGFASDYAGLLLDRIGLEDGTVVDCFMGSGVTGTAARDRGLGFLGIEAHPLIAELAELKLRPAAHASSIRSMAQEVAARAMSLHRSATHLTVAASTSAEPDLIRRSFSGDMLFQLLLLRQEIKSFGEDPVGAYLKWALLGTLRDVADVKVGWPYQRPGIKRRAPHSDPVQRFLTRSDWFAEDIASIRLNSPDSVVVRGDATDALTWRGEASSAHACVSSPPYLNNFDYADATRLELYFWGDVTTWAQMCSNVRHDMLTATTQQSSVGEMEDATVRMRELGSVGETVVNLTTSLTAERRAKGRRGKQYDQVAPAYFAAMFDVLTNLFTMIADGGTCVWLVGDSAPYGVYVDTPKLIGALAEVCGFVVRDDTVLRQRGNRWAAPAGRHTVELTERLLVFEKP
jgi:hypothetical protein